MTTLISSGYVKNEYTLRKLAELKKYPSAVKTGRDRLVDKMNNNQLINMLRAGRQEPVHLTFNNIRTLEAVSYTHLTLPTTSGWCRSRWSPYH